MPRINVEDEWFEDPRRTKLACLVGEAVDTVALAMWKLSQRHYRQGILVVPTEKFESMPHWKEFEGSSLARRVDSGIYICGSRDRFTWLEAHRERGRLGGIAKASKTLAPAKLDLPSSSSSISKKKNKTFVRKTDASEPEFFLPFWLSYPRKEKKPEARASFRRLSVTKELLDKIIADIERRKKTQDWIKEGGQFIPLPASYLNQRRWEDEGLDPIQARDWKDEFVADMTRKGLA